ERIDDGVDLAAPTIGDDVEWRPVEDQPADLLLIVHLVAQPVEVAQQRGAHVGVVLGHRIVLSLPHSTVPALPLPLQDRAIAYGVQGTPSQANPGPKNRGRSRPYAREKALKKIQSIYNGSWPPKYNRGH